MASVHPKHYTPPALRESFLAPETRAVSQMNRKQGKNEVAL